MADTCQFLRITVTEADALGEISVLVGWEARVEKYKREGAKFGKEYCQRGLRVCRACKSGEGCPSYQPISSEFTNNTTGD